MSGMSGMDALRAALEAIDPADVAHQQRIDTIGGLLEMVIEHHTEDVHRIQHKLAGALTDENPLLSLFCLYFIIANVRRGLAVHHMPGMLDLDAACQAVAQEVADSAPAGERSEPIP
jgi:hypothetical protein